MPPRELYLIRHGQASFGARDYDDLSDAGLEQAALVGRVLRSRGVDVARVVGGDMRRHRQTAEACLTAMDEKAEYQVDPLWNEYDHQEVIRAFEPRYASHDAMVEELLGNDHPERAFERMFRAALDRWTGGANDHDYTESWTAFRARVASGIDRLAAAPPAAGAALVFTSGGPIAAACQVALGLPAADGLRLARGLANASITKLAWSEGRYRLRSYNEHSHFSGDHAKLLTFR